MGALGKGNHVSGDAYGFGTWPEAPFAETECTNTCPLFAIPDDPSVTNLDRPRQECAECAFTQSSKYVFSLIANLAACDFLAPGLLLLAAKWRSYRV